MKHNGILKNSIIIAAHPDDELLWFGGILRDVDQIVLVYEDFWPQPDVGQARNAVLQDYPRDNVISLKIPEAATNGCADWGNPKIGDFGIELGFEATLRDLKQQVKRVIGKSDAPAEGIETSYKKNYNLIYDRLKSILTPDMNVFTHNPWGEYGHEDHLQVYRVVEHLRQEIGFKQWMSNYCSERALPLAMTYFHNEEVKYFQVPVDKRFSNTVADVYHKHGCWTWAKDWKWFPFELYTEAPFAQSDETGQPHLLPLNMFRLGE